MQDWDPMDIQEYPEVQDEYDPYITPIYKLLQERKTDKELFDFLWRIETEEMELPGNRRHTQAIAHKLVQHRLTLCRKRPSLLCSIGALVQSLCSFA